MESPAAARPLPGLRLLFAAAALLVVGAGAQLFFFSERTDEFFAWTIASPLTAAVDGAFFLSALVLFIAGARATSWAEVRSLAYAVLVVATVKLVATLLDLDSLHFDGPGTAAQIAAWGWLVVYIVVTPVLAGLIVLQLRSTGADRAPGPSLPRPLAAALVGGSAMMAAIGAIQLLASAVAIDFWPWPLTALTSHALSGWFLGVGVLAALTARDNDLLRARALFAAAAVLAALLIVALVRYESEVDWGRLLAWVFVGLILTLAFIGVYGFLALRAARQAARSGAGSS